MLTLPAALRADCSRCAGLCCVVPAFYAVQGFAFDKPAHTPCVHLTAANRCAIHTERAAHGFPGCAGFDCYGAGQRVTREVSRGTSWRTSRETAARVFAAYTCYLALHRLMAALALAEVSAPGALAARLRARREQLDELCRTEDARSGRLDIASLHAETANLLREARGRALADRDPNRRRDGACRRRARPSG